MKIKRKELKELVKEELLKEQAVDPTLNKVANLISDYIKMKSESEEEDKGFCLEMGKDIGYAVFNGVLYSSRVEKKINMKQVFAGLVHYLKNMLSNHIKF